MSRPTLITLVLIFSLAIGLTLGGLNGSPDGAVIDLASREGFFHSDCANLKGDPRESRACTTFVRSAALSEEVPVRVIVPPGYPANAPYSVVYFLHGRDSSMLPDRQSMAETLGFPGLMAARPAGPAKWILVAPQDRRGHDYWLNGAKNGRKWNDFLAWDLPEEIERGFPVNARSCARLLAGVSMGAYGAFYHFVRHPMLYAGFAAHSPLFRLGREEVEVNGHDPVVFGLTEPELNKTLLTRIYRRAGVHHGRPMWIDIGDHDQLALSHYKSTFDFIRDLKTREPNAKVTIHEGKKEDHSYGYWIRHLPEALDWYDATLANACTTGAANL